MLLRDIARAFNNKPRWMETLGNLKMDLHMECPLETLNWKTRAWRPNKLHCNLNSGPTNRAFGAHHWNTNKSTPYKHVKQERCDTNGKNLRKWLRPELWSILGPKMTPKIGPLRPIFNTPLRVAQIDMYTETDAKPVEFFLENDQRPESLLIFEPKVAHKLGLWGPYSPHI